MAGKRFCTSVVAPLMNFRLSLERHVEKIFNIKVLIAILLLIIFLWFGYLFMKDHLEPSISLSPGNGPYKTQETEKKERTPKKISEKENNFSSKKAPESQQKKSPKPSKEKKTKRVDFILISPNPIGIRFGYQITVQAFGFQFKDTREKPPLDTDPLLPENQKHLKEKYLCLGPIAVHWKSLSPNPPNPRGGCFFKVIPQKGLSKATVIPLFKYGELDPGIMAFLGKNPKMKNQGKVIISEYERVPKHVPQEPMKIRNITIGKDGIFELWGEQDGKIYGRVFMKEGTEIAGGYSRTVWDKKLLMKAFDLQNHEAFLQNIKSTLWKEIHPFIDYRFCLAITRYISLEKGRDINLRMEQEIEQFKITKLIKENEVIVHKVNLSPYKGPTLTEINQAMINKDSAFLMKVIKSKHSYTRHIFRFTRRDKRLRNLLVFQLRDFASHYPQPKQYDPFYADLLYTVAMIGVATPEEEQLVIQYWRGTPPGWDERHTWWRD